MPLSKLILNCESVLEVGTGQLVAFRSGTLVVPHTCKVRGSHKCTATTPGKKIADKTIGAAISALHPIIGSLSTPAEPQWGASCLGAFDFFLGGVLLQ